MKPTHILIVLLSFLFLSCSEDSNTTVTHPNYEYARLTRISGSDQFGTRYFWETRETKTDAMDYKILHKHFNVEAPIDDEIKITPYDYKVIDKICASGWQLAAVNSTAGHSDPPTYYSPVLVYHFTRQN